MVDTVGRIFIFLLILFIGSACLSLTGCAGGKVDPNDISASQIHR